MLALEIPMKAHKQHHDRDAQKRSPERLADLAEVEGRVCRRGGGGGGGGVGVGGGRGGRGGRVAGALGHARVQPEELRHGDADGGEG